MRRTSWSVGVRIAEFGSAELTTQRMLTPSSLLFPVQVSLCLSFHFSLFDFNDFVSLLDTNFQIPFHFYFFLARLSPFEYSFLISFFYLFLTDKTSRERAISALTSWSHLLLRCGLSLSHHILSRKEVLLYAHLLAFFSPFRDPRHHK